MLKKIETFQDAINNGLKDNKEVYIGMMNTCSYRLEKLINIDDNIIEFTSSEKHYIFASDKIIGIFTSEKS